MYNSTDQAFLFKETWSHISRNHYNSDTPILARVKKKYDLQGKKDHVAVPLGMAGGVGGLVNGYLPEGGGESGGQMEITAKDVVGVAIIDRKAMKAAMTDRGSFERFTQRPVAKCVESYDVLCNLLWHGDGNARIGLTKASSAYVSGGATAPVIEFNTTDAAYSFFDRWFEPNFQVNIGNSGDTGVEDAVYKISSVDSTNNRVTFSRVSGSFDASSGVNGRYVYIQNMFKAAPQGFQGILMATSGSPYGITYDANRWGSYIQDAAGAPISISLLNKVFNVQLTRVSAADLPSMIVTSPEIWSILSDQMEGQKRINLSPRDKNLTIEAGFGFAALAYTTPAGKVIPIVSDRHCRKDRLYGLYDEVMYMHHLPDQGWWDEDGRVFLRVPGRPWYSATYGGYFENVIHPTFNIVIKNLSYT